VSKFYSFPRPPAVTGGKSQLYVKMFKLKSSNLKKKKKKSAVKRGVDKSYSKAFLPRSSFNDGVSDGSVKVITVDCRVYGTFSSGTAAAFSVQETDLTIANLGSRAIAFADLYSDYRICGVKIVGKPHSSFLASGAYAPGTTTWAMAMPLVPKSTFAASAGMTTFVDFPHFSYVQDFGRENLQIHLGREYLLSHMVQPWLKTTPTGVADTDHIQMCLQLAAVPSLALIQATQMDFVMDVTLEFQGPIDPSLNPLDRKGKKSPEKEEKVSLPKTGLSSFFR